MGIIKKQFGTVPPEQLVELYTITNRQGASVSVSTLGCAIVSLIVPDKNGMLADIVLGYDTPEEYLHKPGFIGVVIGRYANRIANGRFTLNDAEYVLEQNCLGNALHGGSQGFDKQIWTVDSTTNDSIVLSYTSEDGEAGYPGRLETKVTYRFDHENTLSLHYSAVSSKDTVCNLTNHSYFNLDGHNAANLDSHTIQVMSDYILQLGDETLPTGEFLPVWGSVLDLNQPVPLKEIHKNVGNHPLVAQCRGLDFTYCLNNSGKLAHCATVCSQSGRKMEVLTDLPGLQVYTSGQIHEPIIGKGCTPYRKNAAFCMETQYYPDSPNHPNFPSAVLRADQQYDHTTIFRFSIADA